MGSQNVLLSASMIQDKAVTFVKELDIENFKVSSGHLRLWKDRNNVKLKTVLGEWLVRSVKNILELFCHTLT